MNFSFKLFGTTALVFLILDFIWLFLISKKMYQNYLGDLMGQTKILPAVLFYLIYVIAVLFFVIQPAIEKESLLFAIGAGALFGLVCYGTYDLTNLATLKNWPGVITIIDLIWGMFVTATTCGITVYLAEHFNWR
ncbi:DUF2177 family protein [Enterococcus sp. DIV0242_7C1]|uniref:Integral membrane protein n=1 Tax=Candidatus Enterococcus dunnyi TaxID=1834192 RepID=A0A200JEK3_9ENTE|nr:MULTISPECIES: DUF2177 family protein [unclassified Enterococcus]MBO0469091.1 DUF2177 family protein [Enterococcus sp. DIV0242_7C1]OUZ35616.1 hypothetical protein A5889_001092 [Enterococcus sp. 9D6_DIV0238]